MLRRDSEAVERGDMATPGSGMCTGQCMEPETIVHQSIIGGDKDYGCKYGIKPDIIIPGCAGGGSNLRTDLSPFMATRTQEEKLSFYCCRTIFLSKLYKGCTHMISVIQEWSARWRKCRHWAADLFHLRIMQEVCVIMV